MRIAKTMLPRDAPTLLLLATWAAGLAVVLTIFLVTVLRERERKHGVRPQHTQTHSQTHTHTHSHAHTESADTEHGIALNALSQHSSLSKAPSLSSPVPLPSLSLSSSSLSLSSSASQRSPSGRALRHLLTTQLLALTRAFLPEMLRDLADEHCSPWRACAMEFARKHRDLSRWWALIAFFRRGFSAERDRTTQRCHTMEMESCVSLCLNVWQSLTMGSLSLCVLYALLYTVAWYGESEKPLVWEIALALCLSLCAVSALRESVAWLFARLAAPTAPTEAHDAHSPHSTHGVAQQSGKTCSDPQCVCGDAEANRDCEALSVAGSVRSVDTEGARDSPTLSQSHSQRESHKEEENINKNEEDGVGEKERKLTLDIASTHTSPRASPHVSPHTSPQNSPKNAPVSDNDPQISRTKETNEKALLTHAIPLSLRRARQRARTALNWLSHRSHSRTFYNCIQRAHTSASEDIDVSSEHALSTLRQRLRAQRESLLAVDDVMRFDRDWLWDAQRNDFRTVALPPSHNANNNTLMDEPSHADSLTHVLILTELSAVQRESSHLSRHTLSHYTEDSQALSLVHTLIRDLLGRGTMCGALFTHHVELDFPTQRITSPVQKVLCGVCILALNALSLFLCLSLSVTQTYAHSTTHSHMQEWWSTTVWCAMCVLWMVESLVVESCVVFTLHNALPLLLCTASPGTQGEKDRPLLSHTLREVDAALSLTAQQLVHAAMGDFHAHLHYDAPTQFFVAHNVLSQQYLSLTHRVEAMLVCAYMNYLPGAVSRQWRTQLHTNSLTQTHSSFAAQTLSFHDTESVGDTHTRAPHSTEDSDEDSLYARLNAQVDALRETKKKRSRKEAKKEWKFVSLSRSFTARVGYTLCGAWQSLVQAPSRLRTLTIHTLHTTQRKLSLPAQRMLTRLVVNFSMGCCVTVLCALFENGQTVCAFALISLLILFFVVIPLWRVCARNIVHSFGYAFLALASMVTNTPKTSPPESERMTGKLSMKSWFTMSSKSSVSDESLLEEGRLSHTFSGLSQHSRSHSQHAVSPSPLSISPRSHSSQTLATPSLSTSSILPRYGVTLSHVPQTLSLSHSHSRSRFNGKSLSFSLSPDSHSARPVDFFARPPQRSLAHKPPPSPSHSKKQRRRSRHSRHRPTRTPSLSFSMLHSPQNAALLLAQQRFVDALVAENKSAFLSEREPSPAENALYGEHAAASAAASAAAAANAAASLCGDSTEDDSDGSDLDDANSVNQGDDAEGNNANNSLSSNLLALTSSRLSALQSFTLSSLLALPLDSIVEVSSSAGTSERGSLHSIAYNSRNASLRCTRPAAGSFDETNDEPQLSQKERDSDKQTEVLDARDAENLPWRSGSPQPLPQHR